MNGDHELLLHLAYMRGMVGGRRMSLVDGHEPTLLPHFVHRQAILKGITNVQSGSKTTEAIKAD
jgi:hypothetical protein